MTPTQDYVLRLLDGGKNTKKFVCSLLQIDYKTLQKIIKGEKVHPKTEEKIFSKKVELYSAMQQDVEEIAQEAVLQEVEKLGVNGTSYLARWKNVKIGQAIILPIVTGIISACILIYLSRIM